MQILNNFRELMKLQPNLWPVQSQKPTSKCHDILIAKELQEDNSDDDDEYQPNKPDKEYLEVKIIYFFFLT